MKIAGADHQPDKNRRGEKFYSAYPPLNGTVQIIGTYAQFVLISDQVGDQECLGEVGEINDADISVNTPGVAHILRADEYERQRKREKRYAEEEQQVECYQLAVIIFQEAENAQMLHPQAADDPKTYSISSKPRNNVQEELQQFLFAGGFWKLFRVVLCQAP